MKNQLVQNIAFTGGRDYDDERMVGVIMDVIWLARRDIEFLIHVGDCPTGLDEIVSHWGGTQIHRADWKKHGKKAGPLRNKEMLEHADVLIAFPGGKGTADCVRQAKAIGIPVIEVPK